MFKYLSSILVTITISLSACAQEVGQELDNVWPEFSFDRFKYDIGRQPCTNLANRPDIKLLFPSENLECADRFLSRLAEAQPHFVPDVPRSGGFKGDKFFGEWELVAYDQFWRGEIDPRAWDAHLKQFQYLTISSDQFVSWSDGINKTTPDIENFWLNPYGMYQHKRRGGRLPRLGLKPTEEGRRDIQISNCKHDFDNCMQLRGIQHLGDAAIFTGWLVYKKKG